MSWHERLISPVTLIVLLWAILIAVSGWVRPLYYSNEEMHYASIAWEMWRHHHFILPIQGGEPYTEKGPLLFWMLHLGWSLFGVSTVWMRLLPELFGLGTLLLLRPFVLQLWPGERKIADLAPFILLGSFFFAAKIPVMRFDVITTFFVVLSLFLFVIAIEKSKKYWFLFSISIALGLLTKGPVLFLFILPPAIVAKKWMKIIDSERQIYFEMSVATVLGILLASAWVIPAILQGGKQYGYALLFSRSVGRIWMGQYLHQNWTFYFFALAMMLLPWILWLPFWSAIKQFYQNMKQRRQDPRVWLFAAVMIPAFLFLTLTAQKGPRYLLPVLPFAAIFIAYVIAKYAQWGKKFDQWLIAWGYVVVGFLYALTPALAPLKMQNKYPWLQDISPLWGICLVGLGLFWMLWRTPYLTKMVATLTISTVLFWTAYHLGVTRAQAPYGDWRQLAQTVHRLQDENTPVAFAGDYQVLEYFGKLDQPLETLNNKDQKRKWIEQHPDGWIVIRDYQISPMQLRLIPVSSYV